MSRAFRGIARVSVLALVIGFAPAASALSQAPSGPDDLAQPSSPDVSRSTQLAVHETAAPDEIQSWVHTAVKAHEDAEEDRRVGRAIEQQASKLSPGRYVWRPERAQSGPVEIVVSLQAQRAYVFRDRKLIAISTVSTGRAGNRTPTGSFPILEKKRVHFSNLYNNAPMPNMQRMTWDGVALHAGVIPGYAASHGCVRLPREFSNLLFGVTSVGTVVHVIPDTPSSGMAALDHAVRFAAAGGTERRRAR